MYGTAVLQLGLHDSDALRRTATVSRDQHQGHLIATPDIDLAAVFCAVSAPMTRTGAHYCTL